MIPLEGLMAIAKASLGSKYFIKIETLDHKHMTMGRRDDRDRDVKEAIIIAGRK
jgi:adenine-specific DNA-methyltransferase